MPARCPTCGMRLPADGICEGCRSASAPELEARRGRRKRLQRRRIVRTALRWLPLAVGLVAVAVAAYLLVNVTDQRRRIERLDRSKADYGSLQREVDQLWRDLERRTGW